MNWLHEFYLIHAHMRKNASELENLASASQLDDSLEILHLNVGKIKLHLISKIEYWFIILLSIETVNNLKIKPKIETSS